MDRLERGDVLVCKPSGVRVMVRRIEPGPRRGPGPMAVLWCLKYNVELTGRHAVSYLLARLDEGTMRKGRTLDAARVIHEATEARRGRREVA